MNDDNPPSSRSTLNWLERIGKTLSGGHPETREQLLETLRISVKRNLIDIDSLSMIEGVLQVSEMQVRDTMIPRSQMVVLDEESELQEMLEIVAESGHSRFPVVSHRKDRVVGVVLAKDLLALIVKGSAGEAFVLDDILRKPVFVPESKRLNVLLKEFRESRQHMAVVIDEYSAIAGLVTIEDVIEQIVGEIDDEHDEDTVDRTIIPKREGHYTVKALTLIEDFNEFFGVALDDTDFDTVGGLVTSLVGRMPKKGDVVEIEGFRFTVKKADSRRVHLLEMLTDKKPLPREEEA